MLWGYRLYTARWWLWRSSRFGITWWRLFCSTTSPIRRTWWRSSWAHRTQHSGKIIPSLPTSISSATLSISTSMYPTSTTDKAYRTTINAYSNPSIVTLSSNKPMQSAGTATARNARKPRMFLLTASTMCEKLRSNILSIIWLSLKPLRKW